MGSITSLGGITALLQEWRSGDESALGRLMPLVYRELRAVARRCLQVDRAGQTLQTTDLVHEAYLRLARSNRVQWQDRRHFFAVAAQLMRRILVDEVRRRGFQKRGGNATRVSLENVELVVPERTIDLMALDEAMNALAEFAPRKCRVVELRFFGGLSVEETAAVLDVSADTVKREWRTAKLWLLRTLSERGDAPGAMESD